MISYYLCAFLTFYVFAKASLYFLKSSSPFAGFVSLFSFAYLIIISDIYFGWMLLNLERFAPFKGNQLFWTSSFMIVFILITVTGIHRDFLHNKSISELVRDLAIRDSET